MQTQTPRPTPGVLAFLALLLAAAPVARAQSPDDVPRVTRTVALENARVVQAPGRVLERATVVARDGLLLAVGPDAPVPFDAERIAADSLTVYAGFIDGLSHAGLPRPKDEPNRDRPKDPGNPPDDEAGIQPDRDVRTLLDPTDKSLEALRKAGFTAAHVVPHGRMLPGSGAVILLSGATANDLVLKGDVSLFAQFETARRMYPGTDMAVMAKMRQLYREAQRRQLMEKLYAENPTGLERPAYDPVHYAFFPVLAGDKPVYFHTESALDLHRALDVHRTLGFPLVLTGLNQGFEALDALKEAGAPLFLTLDLPDAPKKTGDGDRPAPDDSTTAPTTDAATELPTLQSGPYNPAFRTLSYQDVAAEKKNLEARQELERKKYYGAAASMHQAGLRFGFMTMDVKPEDVLENVRTMIENGLPEDVALAALTTTPADILGLSASMGTVEPGKMANLVVTSGPLFDEKTRIRYVFVDGRKFEIAETKKATPGNPDAVVNPAGTWSYTVASPDGEIDGTLTISGTPGTLSGTLSSPMSPDPIALDKIDLDGNRLSFSFVAGQMGRITAQVTINGDTMDGTVSGDDFSGLALSGTRTAGPGR